MKNGLNRFLQAQEKDYLSALSEVKSGRKKDVGCGMYFLSSNVWL